MTRDELEHAIRAACDIADDTELWVFGSQAVLGSYPDAPPAVPACASKSMTSLPASLPPIETKTETSSRSYWRITS